MLSACSAVSSLSQKEFTIVLVIGIHCYVMPYKVLSCCCTDGQAAGQSLLKVQGSAGHSLALC